MTSPTAGSTKNVERQRVTIQTVDPVGQTATALSRYQTTVTIDTSVYSGAVHVTPALYEQWYVRRTAAGKWILENRLAYAVDASSNVVGNVVANPVVGTYQIGSSGPLNLLGSVICAYGPIQLESYPTASLPDPTTMAGALVWDSTVVGMKYSDGTAWNLFGSSTSGLESDSTLVITDNNIVRAAITGDVAIPAASNVSTIGPATVTLSKMADLAANSVIGNTTGSSAAPSAVILAVGATPSSIPFRDGNSNLTTNNLIQGAQTIVSAAGTTTLTVSSPQLTQITGTTTQTVVLPNATTLTVGQSSTIANRSTAVVTVETNGGSTLQSMAAGSQLTVTVLSIDTSAGTWDVAYSSAIPGVTRTITTISSTVAVSPTMGDAIYLLSTGAVLTLPDATNSAISNNVYTLKNITSESIGVLTYSSQTIEGNVGITLAAGDSVELVTDGSNWRAV